MRKITKLETKKIDLPKLKRVAAYARVSVERGRTLHSYSAQVSYYNDLIQKNPEWEFAGVYADLGIKLVRFLSSIGQIIHFFGYL